MICTDRIPRDQFGTWYGIFCDVGGWFLENPREYGDEVWVRYTCDDCAELERRWRMVTTEIREVYPSRWRRVWMWIRGRIVG